MVTTSGKDQGLRRVRGQLGHERGARPGQALPAWLIQVDVDQHICHSGEGCRGKLGRQGTHVAQVLALDPALQHLDGDVPAQVDNIPRVRSILDVGDLGHGFP